MFIEREDGTGYNIWSYKEDPTKLDSFLVLLRDYLFDYCYYHANCNDGQTAGALTLQYNMIYNPSEVRPAWYGRPGPKIKKEKALLVVDFSFDRKTLKAYASNDITTTIIDHHVGTIKKLYPELDNLKDEDGPYYIQEPELNLSFVFDNRYCGAMLLHKLMRGYDAPVPEFIQYINDRDLFIKQKEYTDEFYYMNFNRAFDPKTWIEYDDAKMLGALYDFRTYNMPWIKDMIRSIVNNYAIYELGGVKMPLVTCDKIYVSDVLHQLAIMFEFPCAAAFYMNSKGKYEYSLRSNGFDVGKLAAELGGGGHRQASGFVSNKPVHKFIAEGEL